MAYNEKGFAKVGDFEFRLPKLLLIFVLLLMFTTSAWLYSSSPN
jgi:hypothetical protein